MNNPNPHARLLSQSEFKLSDVTDFILAFTGCELQQLESLESTLIADIDTSAYQGTWVDGKFVMELHEGEKLISRQSVELWMHNKQITDAFSKPRPIKHCVFSNYLTIDRLKQLSRKDALTLEEVVQIIHMDKSPVERMSVDMMDTGDTMARKFDPVLTAHDLVDAREILTLAARVPYPIPSRLVKWVDLPVGSISSKRSLLTSETDKYVTDRSEIGPFCNPPKNKDEWFKAIEAHMYVYKKQHQVFPNQVQAWPTIWNNPLSNFGMTTGKDSRSNNALLMGDKTLNKKAFLTRFRRWTRPKK